MQPTAPQLQTEQRQSPPEGRQEQATAAKKAGLLAGVRKGFTVILAVESWKKQASILRKRASFPLLRRVISTERSLDSTIIPLADIPMEILERSKLGHAIIMAFMAPCLFWAILVTTKGIAALIKFDAPFNGWLVGGAPMVIYSATKLITSNLSYKIFSREIGRRTKLTPIQGDQK